MDSKESANVTSIIEVEDMVMQEISIPPLPPQIVNLAQSDPYMDPPQMIDNVARTFIWQGKFKAIASRWVPLLQGLIQAFTIIWDKCSIIMKGKLKQLPTFQQINAKKNRYSKRSIT